MAITITVPDDCNLAACASEMTSRYAINGVFVKVGAPAADGTGTGWAVATNGRALSCTRVAYQPVDGTDASFGPAGRDASKGLIVPQETVPPAKSKLRQFTMNGRVERVGKKGETFAGDYVEGSFPPFDCVLPTVSDDTHVCIGLNAELLKMVQDAIRGNGDEVQGLTLIIPKDGRKPICAMGPNGLGVVMPVNLGTDQDQFARWETAVSECTGNPKREAPKPKATRKPKAPAAI